MDLEKLLKEAQENRNALMQKIETAKSVQELDGIELELRKQDIAIQDLKNKISERDARSKEPSGEPKEPEKQPEEPEWRSEKGEQTQPKGGFKPMATYKNEPVSKRKEDGDVFNSIEYRKAFMDYVVNGTPIPAE